MPRVRLKFKPPEQAVRYSTEHPDDEYRILSSRPIDEGLLSIVEVDTEDPAAILRHFDEIPEIRSYEVLQAGGGTLLLQHVISEPASHRVARTTGTLASFPLIIRDGWMFVEMTTTHERLSEFTAGLESAGVTFELLSVTQSVDVMGLLTDRQWQFITEAIERGYYDNPRECSVVDLASALDVSQSTASGILHRAEGRIIKEFAGESPV